MAGFNVEKARQAGYSEEEIQQFLSSRPDLQPSSGGKAFLGGLLPVAGGTLGMVAGSLVGPLGTLAGGAGGTSAGYALQNLIEDRLGTQQQTPMEQLSEAAAGTGTAAALSPLGYGATRFGLKAFPWLAYLLRNPSAFTRQGTARLTEQASQQAGPNQTATLEELQKNISGAVRSKLGSTPQVQQELATTLNEVNTGSPILSASDLLTGRRQMLARGGKTYLQNLFQGQNIGDKVSSVARGELSKKLHQLVPETVRPDQLYSFYSKVGDLPTNAKRLVAGLLGYKLGLPAAGKIIRNVISSE